MEMGRRADALRMLWLAGMSKGICEDSPLSQPRIILRPAQDIAVEYNDTVIYPDKVRLNCYYYRNYSFVKDIEMIFATVLGKKIQYAGEEI